MNQQDICMPVTLIPKRKKENSTVRKAEEKTQIVTFLDQRFNGKKVLKSEAYNL